MDLYCSNINTENSPVQTAGNTQDLKKAEELFNTGSRDKAVIILERMVTRNRQNQAAKKCLSRAYYMMASDLNESSKGRLDQQNKVILFLKKSIQHEPRNVDAYLLLGQVYERTAQEYGDKGQKGLAKPNYEKAQAAYLNADHLEPKSKAALSLARVYALLGKPDMAWQCLERYLVNYPQNLGETVFVLQRIIAANPKDIKAHKLLAGAYYNNNKLDLAIQELKQVLDLDPKNAENHANLGMAYLAAKEYDLAVAAFEKALSLEPKNAIYKRILSQACYINAHAQYFSGYLSQQIWDRMMDLLLRAIEVDPDNKDAHLLLGKIYEEIAGVWERKAIKEPTEKDNKKHATAFYKAAINEYLEVLKRDPRNEIVYALVEVCFKLEEYKVAFEALKHYVSKTQDPKAKYLLRMVELKIKEKGK